MSAWGWLKTCLLSAADSSDEIVMELDMVGVVGGCEMTMADVDAHCTAADSKRARDRGQSR